MKSRSLIIWVMVMFLASAGTSRADLVGYVAGDSQLVSMNYTTDSSTNLGPSGAFGFKAIEFSPTDENVYVTTNSGGFYKIDTTSGEASKIADTGHLSLNNLAFAPNGNLFAVDYTSNELVRIDVQTGDVTTIGSLSPYGFVTAFAIDNSGKAVGWDSGAEWLFEVDLVDGSTTSLGYLPGSFDAFDYSSNGVLYGWDYLGGVDGTRLYGIDVANVRLDSSLGWFAHGESGFTLVPEPTTPPIADAGVDIIADASEQVILDASASYDPDGTIVQYTWTALLENKVLYSGPNNTFATKALGRLEEVIKLTVTDDIGVTADDTVSIFNRRLEEIELTPGPVGPQGPQGEQGPAGVTPGQIVDMQAQITALQQANILLQQQNAQLQQTIDDNRYLLEQLPQLRKKLEELQTTVEETP